MSKRTPDDVLQTGKRCYLELAQRRAEMATYFSAYYGQGTIVASSDLETRARALVTLSQQNLLRAICDALQAQSVTSPNFQVLTSTSSFQKAMAARQMARFIRGVYQSAGMPRIQARVIGDVIRGAHVGAVRQWFDGKKLRAERVAPHYIVYSLAAGENPREIWLRYPCNRADAAQMLGVQSLGDGVPKYQPDPLLPSFQGNKNNADRVEMWEYYSKASGGEPGQKVLLCGDKSKVTPWKYDFLPITPLTHGDSFDDYGGVPFAANAYPFHLALQRWNKIIDKGVALACVPRLMKIKNSAVKQLTNQPMDEIEHPPGQAPVIVKGEAFGPEVYNIRDRIIREGFEHNGVSQAFGAAKQPVDTNSGRQVIEQAEQVSQRLSDFYSKIERFNEEIAYVGMALLDDAATEASSKKRTKGKVKVRVMSGAKELQEMDLGDIDLSMDEAVVQVSSVASITRTSSYRIQRINELKTILGDTINPETMLAMLDHPDAEKWSEQYADAVNLALYQIDKALEEGVYVPPETEPLEYLDALVRLGMSALLGARRLPDVPAKNMACLRKLIATAKHFQKLAQPAPAPAPMPAEPTAIQGAA